MSFSHTINKSVISGGATVSSSNVYSAAERVSIDESIPDSSTDLQINAAIDVDQIASIYILASVDMTLEVNDGTTPDDTISLVGGVPYCWDSDSYFANLLTTDVTALFLTNASGSNGTFKLECVYDPTP